jgi:CHRD domain
VRLRRVQLVAVVGLLVAASATGSAAVAGGDSSGDGINAVQVRLTGYEEDPNVLSTTGVGHFRALISGDEISYQLSYANLEGAVAQAHIHFGGSAQSGGISVFLCTNLGNAPAQACPAAPATITGTITAADVIGPTGQGIAAGEFGELVAAIRAGKTYVNVHTSLYPGGEVRGQLAHHH